jgi:hypothetical protein
MSSQVVYLRPDATTFEASCEACRNTREGTPASRQRAAHVEGSLRRDVDIGFRTCRRGHRLLVKRVRLVGATSRDFA